MSTLRVDGGFQDGSYYIPAETVIRGCCKAWVNFNGTGVVAIRGSYNVSSITDHGTGDYTFNVTSGALPDANYAFIMQTGGTNSAFLYRTVEDLPAARTSTTVRAYALNFAGTANIDPAQVTGLFWR